MSARNKLAANVFSEIETRTSATGSNPSPTLASITPTLSPITPPFISQWVEGAGLHTNKKSRLRLTPADQNEGVSFSLAFQGNAYAAPALWTRLSATSRSTSLVLRGPTRRRFELKTVEHLMAALFAAGLPNLRVDIEDLHSAEEADPQADVIELPVLDGSARDWMPHARLVMNAQVARAVWIPVRSFEISDGSRGVLIAPWADGALTTEFQCAVEFGAHWAQQKTFVFDWTRVEESFHQFAAEIASARTFGFQHELDELARKGLARGGTFDNALLLDGDRVCNQGGFRVEQELAAHKLLDAVGDFALLGSPILGSIRLTRAGHSIHLRALEEAVRQGALVKGWIDNRGRIQREPL